MKHQGAGLQDGEAVNRGGGRWPAGTSTRFVRRLIFERRIAFVKVGRHVRIAPKDLDAFVAAGRIDALQRAEAG